MMPVYFAMRIKAGKLSYAAVFSVPAYQVFQADVDAILIADGFENLIVQ